MNRAEVIEQARDWLDDEVEPFLYPQERLERYADEGHTGACIRMRVPFDSQEPELCAIQLVAGQVEYPLHPAIIVVRRVEYRPAQAGAKPCVLRRTTFDQLDWEDPSWSTRTGRPEAIVQDMQRRMLRLSHIPRAEPGTLQLTVWRRPLECEGLRTDTAVPLFDEMHHLYLAHWICYRAFLKKDGEANDGPRAAEHLAQFEQHFGPMPDAARIRALSTDDAGEVRPHWF
jgi:hypothetical protein